MGRNDACEVLLPNSHGYFGWLGIRIFNILIGTGVNGALVAPFDVHSGTVMVKLLSLKTSKDKVFSKELS